MIYLVLSDLYTSQYIDNLQWIKIEKMYASNVHK